MQFIRLLKPKTENIYITSMQVEVSEACYNVPTMKIDKVQDVNIADISNIPFAGETNALNTALSVLNNMNAEGIKWFQSGTSNKFITRLLTDEQGGIATDQLISQWKNGTITLYLTDVYVTLDRK